LITIELSINKDLRSYSNEFAEFNDRCEKLCDEFEHIAINHESISSYSVRGMKENAVWLKNRINELNLKLENLCRDEG
jgi:uncharacterized protein YdcH (DUF465 family)